MDSNTHNLIKEKLDEVEEKYNIKMLYALESGSRLYGFPSEDSDWDIRFIYKSPMPWYISIQNKRDTLEINDTILNFDFVGWDIKKALFLLSKSNPSLLEWLQSPIIYKSDEKFHRYMQNLTDMYFSPRACFYHHLGLIRSHRKRYIDTDADKMSHKKYLYVIRSIFACNWIETRMTQPPAIFEKLFFDNGTNDSTVREEIKELIGRKREGLELDEAKRNPIFDQYIQKEFDRLIKVPFAKVPIKNKKTLDAFLWEVLNDY